MNTKNRLFLITLGNIAIVLIMLARVSSMGIDIDNTTLVDNTSNLSFMFDFVSFLIILFFFNAFVMLIPSRRNKILGRIIKVLESKQQKQGNNHNHKHSMRNRKQHG